jgi:hypothetical protein
MVLPSAVNLWWRNAFIVPRASQLLVEHVWAFLESPLAYTIFALIRELPRRCHDRERSDAGKVTRVDTYRTTGMNGRRIR